MQRYFKVRHFYSTVLKLSSQSLETFGKYEMHDTMSRETIKIIEPKNKIQTVIRVRGKEYNIWLIQPKSKQERKGRWGSIENLG